MKLRSLIFAAVVLATPLPGTAQPAEKITRIGYLVTSPLESRETRVILDAFQQGLRELGHVEGANILFEYRSAHGRAERLSDLAVELVRLKVDVIVVGGSLAPHAAKRATTTIPIVLLGHGDPVGAGLVPSLARPGGNVTGMSLLNPELVGKQLELLNAVIPQLARVTVLWNPSSQTHPRVLREAEAAARTLGLQMQRISANGVNDYEPAFSAMAQARTEAFLVLGDPIFWTDRTRIAELALTRKLPAVFVQREHAEAGGLMSYGASLRENARRAASYVDKILKGSKPGDLPVEQATRFELVVNLTTAKRLGLTIPQSVLSRVDDVIE